MKMKRSEWVILITEISIIIMMLFNIFIFNFLTEWALSLILVLITVLLIILLGFEKDRLRSKKDIFLWILIYTISYYLFTYLLGIIFGFVLNGYSRKFINIIKNTMPLIAVCLSSEMLRYQINTKGQEKKSLLIISAFAFILIDVVSGLYKYNLSDPSDLLMLIESLFIPSIAANALLTYLSVKAGYKVTIFYRLIMTIPYFLVPIIPDINTYIDIMFRLFFPSCILCSFLVKNKKQYAIIGDIRKSKTVSRVSFGIGLLLLTIMVYLTSGLFTYYALTIGSGSMEPAISKGDIVIVEKCKEYSRYKVGDVIVFHKEGKSIVHRIIKITKDGAYSFSTKGDANNAADWYSITEQEIVGFVKFKIKYLGYPTVWISEAIRK